MVGIVIATHGKFAEGLLDAVELIMGEQKNIRTVSLTHGMDIENFGDEIMMGIESLDQGKGVLVFVDLFGASPYNQAVMNKNKLKNNEFKIISGVNLPMVIEAASMSQVVSSVNDLWKTVINTGIEGIKDFDEEFSKVE